MAQIDLGLVVGPAGENGTNGQDGATPTIVNGYWYIDGVNTGVLAEGQDGADGADGDPSAFVGTEEVTATSYQAVVADAGKLKKMNNAGAITVTLPTDATANIPVNKVISFVQWGAGAITFAAQSGAVINYHGGPSSPGQFAVVQAVKTGANEWLIIGGVTNE